MLSTALGGMTVLRSFKRGGMLHVKLASSPQCLDHCRTVKTCSQVEEDIYHQFFSYGISLLQFSFVKTVHLQVVVSVLEVFV